MARARSEVLILAIIGLVFTFGDVCSHDGHDHGNSLQTIDGGGVSIWSSSHYLELKVKQGVDLKWLSKDDNWVTMEMSSFTKGYVSVGFCPKWKGTMEGCDIVIGWVDNKNGTPHLYDYYARGNTLPELDVSQDYQLVSAKQDAGVTTITFRRRWNTGDNYFDADLEHNAVRVMWAWHPEDPFSSDSFFKHAGNSRGHMSQDVSFKNPSTNQHHHQQYHSAASDKNYVLNTYFTALWLLALYGLIH